MRPQWVQHGIARIRVQYLFDQPHAPRPAERGPEALATAVRAAWANFAARHHRSYCAAG